MKRPQVQPAEVDVGLAALHAAIARRVQKHGPGAYASRHEALGVLVEEHEEALAAIRDDRDPSRFTDELLDIAVVAIWWIASEQAIARSTGNPS